MRSIFMSGAIPGLAASLLGASMVVGEVPTATPQSSAAPAPVEAFLVSDFKVAFYRGNEKIDCPEGRSASVRDAYLQTQSPAERLRLLKPENAVEFERKYKVDYVFDERGRDICTDPALFDTPERILQKPVQSPVAPGLDLDKAVPGKVSAGTCGHQAFKGLHGESGVDNQYFRAVACNTMWRGLEEGFGELITGSSALSGPADNPIVVVVSGIDSWENDPEVSVLIAAGAEKPEADVRQAITAGASINISTNPRYRVQLRGRIDKGILTTEAGDVTFPYRWVSKGGELIFKRLQMRLQRAANGGLSGMVGGYRPIDSALAMFRDGGPGVAADAGLECASVRKTLRLMADGDPDPRTGQCTSVSTAFDLKSVPAYAFENGRLLNPAKGWNR